MQRSTERILTTHAGSLPRPPDLLEMINAQEEGRPFDLSRYHANGFLTAIAVGPELVMPSEWLPVIWGDDEPVFADEAQMQAVLGGTLSRYNQIRHEIASGTFEPILWSDADGTAIGTDWAEGFMQGVGLRAPKWARLFRIHKRITIMQITPTRKNMLFRLHWRSSISTK
jgi:uncharacterized protein